MSIRAVSLVWERSKAKGSNRLILLAIADYCSDYGIGAFPSNRTLGKKSLLTMRAVQQCLRRLEDDGELRVKQTVTRRFLEIRCITDWPDWPPVGRSDELDEDPDEDDEGTPVQPPANFSPHENFSRGLTPEGPDPTQTLRGQSLSRAGGGCNQEATLDPLEDPLSELLQVDDDEEHPVETVEAVEIPEAERSGQEASPRFLQRLAHAVLAEDPNASPSDVIYRLRLRLAELKVEYHFAVLEKAANAAYWQRRHPPARKDESV